MRDRQTAAQAHRQRVRGSGGRYSNMMPCQGGCGKRLSNEGSYWSHGMTDCVDAEGEGFADGAIMLCARCGKQASKPEMQTWRAWFAWTEANRARRGVTLQQEQEQTWEVIRADHTP